MKPRNIIAVILILISFVLLYPGLTRSLLTITAHAEIFGAKQEMFRETRSILQAVRSLHESGNNFVSGLILLFSVIVPLAKGVLLLLALALRNAYSRFKIYIFVRSISKWSMADVFLVGVYVAFLSAKATDNLDAKIEIGFYYFAAYCLVSLLSLQIMRIEAPRGGAGPSGDVES